MRGGGTHPVHWRPEEQRPSEREFHLPAFVAQTLVISGLWTQAETPTLLGSQPVGFQTRTYTTGCPGWARPLGLDRSYKHHLLPCFSSLLKQIPALLIFHNCMSQFLTVNIFLYVCVCVHEHVLLVLFLWRTLTGQMPDTSAVVLYQSVEWMWRQHLEIYSECIWKSQGQRFVRPVCSMFAHNAFIIEMFSDFLCYCL